MPRSSFSDFELLLLHSGNEVGSSVLLILTWIAASDGKISDSEASRLTEIAAKSNYSGDTAVLIRLAKDVDSSALQLACEILKANFFEGRAVQFLNLAIGVAIADGYLKPTENHILRLIADLLGVSKEEFRVHFQEITGRTIPEPSDLSKAAYWEQRQRQSSSNNSDSGSKSESRSSGGGDRSGTSDRSQRTITAHAILGVEIGASLQEIKKAYRRLAQVHHPDRFSSLGQESVAAATATFQRIQSAYDHLVSHA